jgi:hypothetical protein
MIGANVSFGVKCKRCGKSVGMLAIAGVAERMCSCGSTEFVGDNQWSNVSNFTCPKCGSRVGHMTSNGPLFCPGCKQPI